MQLARIEDIQVDERIRKEFTPGSISELASDIARHGLYHPILTQNDGKKLLAGERRLRAIKSLHEAGEVYSYNGEPVPAGFVPFSKIEDLSPIDLKEVELNENLLREDLTWQERAAAINDLHDLRQAKGESTSQQAIASDILKRPATINEGTQLVRNSLLLREHLDDEEVRNAATEKDALKIVRRKQEAIIRSALAEHFKTQEIDSPHTFLEGDFFEKILAVPDHSQDVLICDPPYGVSANKFSTQADIKHRYEDSPEYVERVVKTLAYESERFCKEQAHAYIFCAPSWFANLVRLFETHGWNCWSTPFIWYKGQDQGMLPAPEYGPHRSYEMILYAIRGKRPVAKQGGSDVICVSRSTRLERAAQKPVDLYKNLLNRSCVPGDRVIDPLCGAGTVFSAAHDLQLYGTGIDNEPEAINLCYKLLGELK